MLFLLISSVVVYTNAHSSSQILDTFVSIMADIEKAAAPLDGSNSVEFSRFYANFWAVGLKCYDAAVKVPYRHDCPDFVELTVAYGLYHMVKQSADHVKLAIKLDVPFYDLIKSYSCNTACLESARLLAMQIAKGVQCERFDDDFYSFIFPENAYVFDPKLMANSSYRFAHYAYYKTICLEADPVTLWPIPTPPKIEDVTDDWNEFYYYASNPQIHVDAAKRFYADFWYTNAVGDGTDTAYVTPDQFQLIARQLINKNDGGNLRKMLQHYVLLMTAVADADKAAWRQMYHYNAYPTELMNYGYSGKSLPYDINWKSLVSPKKTVWFPKMPTYPSADTAVAKAFAVVARKLFPTNGAITVWSTDNFNVVTKRTFANADDLHDSFLEGMVYAGITFRFGCVEGTELGEKVGETVYNLLINGQCGSQYAC